MMKKVLLITAILLTSFIGYSQNIDYSKSGDSKYNVKDYKGAIADYTKAIELNPRIALTYFKRATARQMSTSIKAQVTKVPPDDREYKKYSEKMLGLALEKADELKRALADYTKAIELDPNNWAIYNNRGLLRSMFSFQFLDKKAQLALTDYTKAIELIWLNPNIYINKEFSRIIDLGNGTCCIMKDIDPNNRAYKADIYSNRASVQSSYAEAINDCTTAIDLAPSYSLYIYRITLRRHLNMDKSLQGKYLIEALRSKSAQIISDYTKAIEFKPNMPQLYQERGSEKDKMEIGDYRGAIADYTKAIELDPNDHTSYRRRGFSKAELKDHSGAIVDYNKALELTPKNDDESMAVAYYFRGLSKIAINQKDSGCLDLSKAGELGFSYAYESIKEHCN